MYVSSQSSPTLLYITEPVLTTDYSYKMFEPNMTDYLDDEMEELKRAFEVICKDWERSVSRTASSMVRIHIHISPPALCRPIAHDLSFIYIFCLLRTTGHARRSCALPIAIPDPGLPNSDTLPQLAKSRADEAQRAGVL